MTNPSPATAAQVVVAGEPPRGGEVMAAGRASFDYVPGHSEERGGLFPGQDPAIGGLRRRSLGHARP